MITVRTNLPSVAKALRGSSQRIRVELRAAIKASTMEVWADARARNNWSAGEARPLPPPGPLRALTGMLLRSIAQRVVATETGARGVVGSNLAYARIHELGGTIQQAARSQLPLAKGALTRAGKKFKGVKLFGSRGRQDLGARTFGARTISIPARPYLGPALERRRAAVNERMRGAIRAALTPEVQK